MDEYPLALDPAGLLRGRLEENDGTARLALAGEFDLAAIDGFGAIFDEIANDGSRQIVIDLSAITFIDSSGIRAILEACRTRAEGSGDPLLLDGGEAVRRTFEMAGVEDLLANPAEDGAAS